MDWIWMRSFSSSSACSSCFFTEPDSPSDNRSVIFLTDSRMVLSRLRPRLDSAIAPLPRYATTNTPSHGDLTGLYHPDFNGSTVRPSTARIKRACGAQRDRSERYTPVTLGYNGAVTASSRSRVADATHSAVRMEEIPATPNAPARRTSWTRETVIPPMAKTGIRHRLEASWIGGRPIEGP